MLRLLSIAALLLLQQTPAPAPVADDPVTLHSYVNLVQIPVLVLSNKRLRVPPLSPDQFKMSIDSGPLFPPRHVRQEGSDAIRLVLLLDVTPSTRDLLASFGQAIQDLSTSLTDKDVVSISVLSGSSLSHTQAGVLTAPWRSRLTEFVAQQLPPANPAAASSQTVAPKLWQAIALTLSEFGKTNSRRVLLVITDSKDSSSLTAIPQLQSLASSVGVTVFALRVPLESAAQNEAFVLNRDAFAFAKPNSEVKDPLASFTELTGGTTLEMHGHPLAEGLMRVLRMVRERYILDFVRPSKIGGGVHTLDVHTKQKNLFVRSGGTGVPLPDPAIANDPNTVPSDPTAEPPVGRRRVMTR